MLVHGVNDGNHLPLAHATGPSPHRRTGYAAAHGSWQQWSNVFCSSAGVSRCRPAAAAISTDHCSSSGSSVNSRTYGS
jgi:hypothetical protein